MRYITYFAALSMAFTAPLWADQKMQECPAAAMIEGNSSETCRARDPQYSVNIMTPYVVEEKPKCPGKLPAYENPWVKFFSNFGGFALFSLNSFKGVSILSRDVIYNSINTYFSHIPGKVIFPIVGFLAFEKISYNPIKEFGPYLEENWLGYPNLMVDEVEFSEQIHNEDALSYVQLVCIPRFNPSHPQVLTDHNGKTILVPGLWGKSPAGGKIAFATRANIEVIAERCVEILKETAPQDVKKAAHVAIYTDNLPFPYHVMWVMPAKNNYRPVCE